MESREKRDESNNEPATIHNVMKLFGSFLVADNHKSGQSDQTNRGLNVDQSVPQIVSLSPSEYMRQLFMTTEERMELLTRVRSVDIQDAFGDSHDCSGFEALPNIVVFQQYIPGNVYNVTLTIRNTAKASHYLKLACEIDPTFSVEYKGISSLNTRLAAGMHSTYNVRFSPEENRDYEYEIKILSDRGAFVVPVIAIGPRPILDFPDLIVMPETGVKISSIKSLLVRNLGDKDAAFNVSSTSPSFWLEPSKGVIEEEETVQFVVNFLSTKSGFFEGCLFLTYDTGEVVRIQVQCSAVDCNVRLERGSVRMQEETYLGLSTSKTLKIFNRSEYIVKYQWMRYKDSDTDRDKKEEYKKIFELINNAEIERCMDLVHYNISTPEVHELVCQRIYADEIASLMNENFLYNNSHFSLVPMEGEIWPHNSIEVTVYFEPNEIGELSSTAYLELTGHQDRIPLSLSGLSIGPLLKLNVATIDVQNIFLCSVHNYQVVCANKGFIPGVLVHRPNLSDFGGSISVTPKHIKLQPGQYKAFNVSFSSNRNGDFVERVEFVVKESLQVIAIGCVVCPTLNFDKSRLDLETTALGFTSKQEAILHNDSLVPVTFSICVPDDGIEAVITHEDFVNAARKSSFPSSPREFQIVPVEGIVAAQSSLKVKINFTPNTARAGNTSLRVDMWDTDSVPVSLPIYFQSKVASLVVKPAEIDIRFCFLNYPYARTFTVENKSEVEGCFYIIPQSTSDSTSMQYSMSTHQGYLGPGQSKTVSLTIITRAMGKQKSVMSMLTFGEQGPSACCVLTCNGQGPVVSVQPTTLNWGDVELLQDNIMLLTLISDSPVPAEFTATLGSKNSSWKVFPTSGDLGPGQSIDLQVTIFLRDVGKHVDKLFVTIPNRRDISVSLSAIGIGSCVVCDPPIFPTFDMGLLFSNQDISLPIDVTNQGSRNLKLVFSNSMEIKLLRGGQIQTPAYDRFSVEPLVVELPAQSTTKVFCNVRSDACETVSEEWWLHCFFEGQGKREILNSSTFIAKFIKPSISFSKRELIFRVDMGHDAEKSQTTDELFVTNESGLNLHCLLRIDEPFGLITETGDQVGSLKVILKEHANLGVRVIFSPKEEKNKCHSKTYDGTLRLEYEEHPNADKIKCLASVNFPNIAPLPGEIRFDCPLGCSVVENIFLKNDGPLEVSYKFVWIEESISIVHDSSSGMIEESESTMKAFGEEHQSANSELLAETKDLLMEILTNGQLKDETELKALESPDNELQNTEEINRICSIVPCEGIVPAYSSQCISIGFHGMKTLRLEAQLLCEIDGGPSELIKLFAAADDVRFGLEKDRIDFGQQVIFELSRETIKLENHSSIHLIYHVELAGKLDQSLGIRPMSATIPAQSTTELEITSRPVVPGTYKKKFKLCIENSLPLSIFVEGDAIVSQVYVSLPRDDFFKNYSVEVGYRAVQIVLQSLDPNNTLEEDERGWQVVTPDDTWPSATDIEMAIERLIAKEFIEETYSLIIGRSSISKGQGPIPYLFAPEYVLDMGYVIVGQSAQASTRVYNYGTRSVKIRLNKSNKMETFTKEGIIIHFKDENCLMPSEYANLEVSFKPVRLKSPETSSVIRRKCYLEVTNGFTLPIMITATVTHPFVTLSSKILDFNEVLISECMLMHLRIKNEGLIDCQWEAKLPPIRRNQTDGPFCLQNTTDVHSPGQSGSIKIYFKPQKSGYVETKLTVEVRHGLEPIIVDLRGRGIEHKLKILQPRIRFPAVLPHSFLVGKNFTIENVGQRAVEIYWQHLEQPDPQEERLIRVLTHYYQVDEILLPPQRPPDSSALPHQLFDFYNSLVNEMARSVMTQRQKNAKQADDDAATIVNYSEEEPRPKRRGSSTQKMSRKLTRTGTIATALSEANLSILSEIDAHGEKISNLRYDDPDEIEKLVHCFIEDLQKQPDFYEKMKDPVREVFDSLENKELQLNISSLPKKRKICIIFHGDFSTEYEQAACKTSRVLGVPLLNLNNAITEIIALGNTACSAKLREIIDAMYRGLLTENEKSQSEDTMKILTIEELSTFDSLTRHEYKIEAIQDCGNRKNISATGSSPRGGKGSAKGGDKSPQTPRIKIEETFLDIDVRLLNEILEQRLAMPDLSESFVLQTLNNNFIRSEEKTLALLLQILGDVEYPVFVTFHKFVESRESPRPDSDDSTQPESTDETLKKLMQIDEMSGSEFDILSNADKELYRDRVLLARTREALQRRMEFQRRISELRKQKEQRKRNISKNSKERSVKKSKSRTLPQTSRASDKLTTLELPNKKKNAKIDSTKNSTRKTVPEEMQAIDVDTTDADASNLEKILSILQTWDPTRKSIVPSHKETGRSKISKKDAPTSAAGRTAEVNERFWIWRVKANSSDRMSSEVMIVNEMTRTMALLNPKLGESSLEVEPELRSQVYSVVRPKKLTPPVPVSENGVEQAKVFDVVALKYNNVNFSSDLSSQDERISEPLEEPLESRLVLQPHESRIFRVKFCPKRAGFFQEEFPLIILNSNQLSYGIKVNGSGDIPRLNMEPSLIFKKIKEVKIDEMNDPTFFTDTHTFDFGSLLLTGKDNKVHRKKTSFKFWNPSKMDLELEISLLADNLKTYDIEPRQLLIEPNKCGVINATAAATKLGPNEDQLFLLVKGNPRVEVVQMRSNGAKLEVELEGKQISFGKILIYREVTKTLRVLNNSLVPIYWRITPVDSVDQRIKISSPNGWTKARAETNILVTYLANRIGVLEKKTMEFKVFLNEDDDYEDPLFNDIITASGETYDVAFDINFANPIALPTVTVGSMASTTFTIKNRGAYDVNFGVEFEKNEKLPTEIDRFLRRNLREDLHISPSVGTVGPDKIATINVNFQPKLEMRLKEAPLLRCSLMDANDSATIVAQFSLTVSIASHYARFRLIPDSEISFGPVSVCTKKSLHFSIENIGIFPLKYQLKNPFRPATSEEGSKKQKKDKSSRADTNKQGTAKSRDVVANLQVGPFTFSKSEGNVAPGDIETLKIDCYPEMEGHVEERILVLVADSAPNDRPGRSINLNVDSCLPSIDFSDLDAIFQESYLVDDVQDFICPKGIDDHTIFARLEKTLHFERVVIHKTHTATIKLYNRGTVPARVTVILRPDVLTPKNAKPEAFVLDTVQEIVLPMSSQTFAVSFTPSLIETYTGILEATVESPLHTKIYSINKLSIKLLGEGCVPEVILVQPPMSSVKRAGNSRIGFGRCLVRDTSFRNLAFENVGKITAKVIVGICHDHDMIYAIRDCENVPPLTGHWINEDDDSYERENHSVVRTLHPGEVARFLVEFQPKEVGRKEAELRIHVLDNPYENLTIELNGEGFVENVVLVGLPLVEMLRSSTTNGHTRSRKPTKHRSGVPSSITGSSISIALETAASAPALVYNLDYGTCFVKKMHKINFKIVNKCEERYFRFELGAHPNVVFVPCIGHLQRSGSKDIAATFLAAEPITLRQFCLECEIYEILLPGEREEVNLWDDRQTSVEWIPVDPKGSDTTTYEEGATEKTIVPSLEPSHEVVAGTGRTIRLMFSAIAAFSEYSCSVKEINFKDTLMFQSREYSFSLENPGNVDLFFDWKIEMDVEYPRRLADSALRAAAFRPQSARTNDSRPSSRSSGGVLYPDAEKRSFRYIYSRAQRGDEENLKSSNLFNDCRPLSSRDKFYAIPVEPYACPCASSSDLFSNSAARTQRSTESWIGDGDDQPFSVKPICGVIPAGQSLRFTLRFSPLDVFDYKACLACQIENLDSNLEPLTIPVVARSLLPYCHFEVEESDYLARREQSEQNFPFGGSGDSNDLTPPRVVEFRVTGTGESHEKQFYLINPTTEDYRFTWKDITSRGPEELPYFHCVYEEGLAESGKRCNVVFNLFAEETGTFESLWRFSIDEYSLETLFLLVAIVTEPAVRCLDTRLRMKPSILGSKVEDTVIIVNDENFELPFKILPNSLRSEEESLQTLTVAPMAGILKPKSEHIFQVSFVPSNVGEFSFPLQCQVKRMKSPLSVVVIAKVGKIMPSVRYRKGRQMLEAHHDRETILDFGKLSLNKPAAIEFEIANIGDVVFHYIWELGVEDPGGAYSLTISTETELVPSKSVSTCYLELTALQKTIIRRIPVTLIISKGPVYRMLVKASAKRPSVEFSFIEYNFGPCYIRANNAPAYVAQLSVTNNDKTPAIIECDFPENLPHIIVNLEALSQAIPGHSTVTLPISFRPLKQLRYSESLNFLMNDSTIQQIIDIKGEGIPYKISLENLGDKFVELGHVPVGKIVTRKVRVLNAGRAPVEISFDLIKTLPGYEEHRRLLKAFQDESVAQSKKKSGDKEENILTIKQILNIQPRDITYLPANKSVEVVVKFKPTKRMNSFVEKIGAQVDSTILPIFFLRGSCVAREFRLNRPHLYFGTIVEGCSSETKLVLQNTGDFGARFKWNIAKLKPHFDLKPISGYCSTGMDVTFAVTFHPVQLASLLEAEATLEVEKHPSLRLSCSGACCRIPDPIESLKFSVPVRSAQTRDIRINNDSNVAWNVRTVLSGEFFFTEETFSIPANKSHSCSLTYAPLVMNNERNPHQGKLVVKLPEDKQPLVYTLLGLSLPPVVVAKILRQLPAKIKYAELLPVHNWLNNPQSFRCDIRLVNDLKTNPVLYSFTGNSKLDVPASGTRDFRALFYCYKEATLNFQITFTNDEGEYEFYEVQYKVSKPEILSTIKLTTSARSSTCYFLQIDNPLEDRSVSFTANCQHRDITIQGVPKVVSAKKSDNIAIEYSPVLPGEGVAKLEVNCSELGNFPYELKLKATASPPEKISRVTAMLGSSTTFPIVIGNPSKRSAEFLIKVDDPSFTCDKSVTVPSQKENILEITYEPCDAKNVTAALYAVSETLGEFIFPLIGSYTLPKPQGPFTISPNSSLSIVFKNIFAATKTFEYILDAPDVLSILTSSDVIQSKKVATIVVNFRSSNDPLEPSLGGQYPVTGKLLVSSSEPALSHIVWVYYLRGIRE